MSVALLTWLLGAFSTTTLGLVVAVMLGQLVPGSRAERAEALAEARKETIEALHRTNTVQADSILLLQAGSQATERLITALKAAIPQGGKE